MGKDAFSERKGGSAVISDIDCFFDHVPSIRALLQAKRFMLVKPLIGMCIFKRGLVLSNDK